MQRSLLVFESAIKTEATKNAYLYQLTRFLKWSKTENPWLVFQIYADIISQQCTDATVPDWIDRLGGVDLFTYDHCWKISESQRID